MTELVLLKLGGSLITDKTRPYTPLLDKMEDLTQQIRSALENQPRLQLIVGHGAGSFGHVAASQYKTRDGLPDQGDATANYWTGFAEVWYQAAALNRFVMQACHNAGLRTIALPPSASVIAASGQVRHWDLRPLRAALAAGLTPVIFGDTVFDEIRGGTILSTEDLFMHLTRALHPQRILLAGLEAAVWADFPHRTRKVDVLTPASFEAIQPGVGRSAAADVTGGMESKVRQMLELVSDQPELSIQIFSGIEPGNLLQALRGEALGTLIQA